MTGTGSAWRATLTRARSLRTRLAILYAAMFCASAVALGALAVIFKPNFIVHSGSHPDPDGPQPPAGSSTRGVAIWTTITHDARQHIAGVALVAIMVFLALIVGWFLAGRVLRPIRSITSSARLISAGNLHQRLALAGPPDEFAQLGETLDELFARLEASFEAQRRFVANASHELRTPLAAGRALLQVALADPAADPVALRSACEEVLDLGDQQERLIDALLTLATSERGIEQWQPFDLAAIAQKVLADREAEARSRGIAITSTLTAAPLSGDPRLAKSLLANLIDNALRHNRADGTAEISIASAGGRVLLTVSNSGAPVAASEIDGLFQPFQRLGADRVARGHGHGLGLAIVKAIATAHGATIDAAPRPGGGLRVQVSFPLPNDVAESRSGWRP